MLVSVALGYFAGQLVLASGLGSLVVLLLGAFACPAVMCLLSRSWRVALGLLVNSVLMASLMWETYQDYRGMGLDDWWREFPSFVALGAIVLALSLLVTVPLSSRARATLLGR
jgi:hypothetical protein